jgi:hypothetical protein
MHGSLEHTGSISQTERHDSPLVKASVCTKSGLIPRIGFDANLLIAGSEIKRREITITTKLVERFVNAQQGIHVLYGILVEISILNTKS